MDIFFQDPSVIPLPPDEVRIKELRTHLLPDKRRVRVYLEVTPFQKRPNGEISIYDPSGEEIANTSIIETMTSKMELTMHLRGAIPVGQYQVNVSIYYEDVAEDGEPGEASETPSREVVDTAQSTFEIQAPIES